MTTALLFGGMVLYPPTSRQSDADAPLRVPSGSGGRRGASGDRAVAEILFYMKDLFPHVPVTQPRAFAACHRLIARGALRAKLDNLLWENSHLEVVA